MRPLAALIPTCLWALAQVGTLEALTHPEIPPGRPTTLLFRARGPLFAPAEVDMPPGWRLLQPLDEPLKLDPGEEDLLLVVLQPDPGTPAGLYSVILRVGSAQSAARVRILSLRHLEVRVEAKPDVAEGNYRVRFRILNQGSQPEEVGLRASATQSRVLRVTPSALRLAPGQVASVEVELAAQPPEGQAVTDFVRLEADAGSLKAHGSTSVLLLPPPTSIWARFHTLPATLRVGVSSREPELLLEAHGPTHPHHPDRLDLRLSPQALYLGYTWAPWNLGITWSTGTHKVEFGYTASGGKLLAAWGNPNSYLRVESRWEGTSLFAQGSWEPAGFLWATGLTQQGVWLPEESCEVDTPCSGSEVPLRYRWGFTLNGTPQSGPGYGANLDVAWGADSLSAFLQSPQEPPEKSPGFKLGLRYTHRWNEAHSFSLGMGWERNEWRPSVSFLLLGPTTRDRVQAFWEGGSSHRAQITWLGDGINVHLSGSGPPWQGSLRLERTFVWKSGQWTLATALEASATLWRSYIFTQASWPTPQGTWHGEVGVSLTPNAPLGFTYRLAWTGNFSLPLYPRQELAQLEGCVVDSEGKPVSNLYLLLSPWATRTNEAGCYRFPAVEPGEYTLAFAGSGLLSAPPLPLPLTLVPGENRRLDLRIEPVAVLQGQVKLRPPEVPQPNVMYGMPGVSPKTLLASLVVEARRNDLVIRRLTDAEGRFTFGTLPVGRWQVRVYLDRFSEAYAVEPTSMEVEVSTKAAPFLEFWVRPLPRPIRFEEEESL